MSELFERVAGFYDLRAAAQRASRGCRRSMGSASFIADLEQNVLVLQRELLDDSYRPGPFQTFRIRDPKPRTISAAPFRDRVVHHAVCTVLEPVFEAEAISTSFACRTGKGNRAAVAEVQRLTRLHPWYARLDIRHCFETMDLRLLSELLSTHFRDRRLLDLLDRILAAGGDAQRRGLPIGNLTSQHFANFMLGEADRYAVGPLGVAALVRYMDDFVLFGADKATVRAQADALAAFFSEGLQLEDKTEARVLAPVHVGLPFLGFRIWPHTVRLDAARKRRLRRKLRALDRELAEGAITDDEAQRRAASLVGWADQADTLALRRSWNLA